MLMGLDNKLNLLNYYLHQLTVQSFNWNKSGQRYKKWPTWGKIINCCNKQQVDMKPSC